MSVGDETKQGNGISADEVALYDRQIRLWGMAAQERMRNARVLLISTRALANEVIKNLVLAGIGSITLLDDAVVTEVDLGAQFLISEEALGKSRASAAAENARKLNPRVRVEVDEEGVGSKSPEFFAQFSLVVACDLGLSELVRINNICREHRKPFYAAAVPGLTGYIFADLVEHEFVTEREEVSSKGERQKITVPHKKTYASLEEVLKHSFGSTLRPKLRKKVSTVLPLILASLRYAAQHDGNFPHLQDEAYTELVRQVATDLGLKELQVDPQTIEEFVAGIDSELSPVAAIVGGVLSQDVLNVLSGRESPVQNFFVFDGNTGDGPIYKL